MFTGQSIEELVGQQASTIFVDSIPSYNQKFTIPYYVVGLDKKAGRILLALPSTRLDNISTNKDTIITQKDKLLMFNIGRTKKIINNIEAHLDVFKRYYSQDPAMYSKSFYNADKRIFEITAYSPGSFIYKMPYYSTILERISDEEIINFNVYDYCIASGFSI